MAPHKKSLSGNSPVLFGVWEVPSLNQGLRPWKLMVGRWDALFSDRYVGVNLFYSFPLHILGTAARTLWWSLTYRSMVWKFRQNHSVPIFPIHFQGFFVHMFETNSDHSQVPSTTPYLAVLNLRSYPIPPWKKVYLPTWMLDFYGI